MFLYELALQLGLRSTDLVERARGLGIDVGPSSYLTPEQVQRLAGGPPGPPPSPGASVGPGQPGMPMTPPPPGAPTAAPASMWSTAPTGPPPRCRRR